jgi:hypothetical protein
MIKLFSQTGCFQEVPHLTLFYKLPQLPQLFCKQVSKLIMEL